MSPPDTNLETQKRRHRVPLIGMGLVVVLAVGLILFWIAGLFDPATESDASDGSTPAGASELDPNLPAQSVAPGDPDTEIEVSE